MTTPMLEIDLGKIYHNALTLTRSLKQRGISVTGVMKATMGAPEVANVWLKAGVAGLSDSRIENLETMRRANITAAMTLVRSPMLSQADEVVALAEVSLNTEIEVISRLSSAAQKANCIHGVILMVELGDLREGIMPCDIEATIRDVLRFPNIKFQGVGTNLACRSGVCPDRQNMAELSALADSIDSTFGPIVRTVSGGNSANLQWALNTTNTGRINNLRLGETMLLGCESLHRQPVEGLYTDAITLFAEVIELKNKPSKPWGEIAQSAFGDVTFCEGDQKEITQAILAIGRQDIDPEGMKPPYGLKILAASSDHLILDTSCYTGFLSVGSKIPFQLNYSALLRAMTSPYITKVMNSEGLLTAEIE